MSLQVPETNEKPGPKLHINLPLHPQALHMIRLVILALAIYGLYMLFFQKKQIKPENGRGKENRTSEYTDYEEIK